MCVPFFLVGYKNCRHILFQQPLQLQGLRLTSVSSQDSGFTSQDTLFLRPMTPSSLSIQMQVGFTWLKVFRIIPEFRILKLTFCRKSASKCWIRQIILASGLFSVHLKHPPPPPPPPKKKYVFQVTWNFKIGTVGRIFFILLKVFTWGRWGNNMGEQGNPLEIP